MSEKMIRKILQEYKEKYKGKPDKKVNNFILEICRPFGKESKY